jgi:hypothetical protein
MAGARHGGHCNASFGLTDRHPFHPDPTNQQAPLHEVALDQLRIVHQVLHGWDLSEPVLLITMANASNMVDGKKHTHRTCIKGPERDQWINTECVQCDNHHSYSMYGDSVAWSKLQPDAKNVHPIWNYS